VRNRAHRGTPKVILMSTYQLLLVVEANRSECYPTELDSDPIINPC